MNGWPTCMTGCLRRPRESGDGQGRWGCTVCGARPWVPSNCGVMPLSDVVASAEAGAEPELALDPFVFFPNLASRIAGLGGTDVRPEDPYAFHGTYVRCTSGIASFRLKIDNLVATTGTLVLRINAISLKPGSHARLLKSQSIVLSDLAHDNGEHVVDFKAKNDMLYAVLGQIHTPTDASATGMTIYLSGRDDGTGMIEDMIEARRTVFGKAAARNVARLISMDRATLADPVSQMCTAAQFDEPAYARWIDAMKTTTTRHRKQWEFVYILQVLERYGMLRPGAQGLGFGVGVEPLPAVFAAMGCQITATDLAADDARAADWSATDQHVSAVADLRRPDIVSDATFDAAVRFRPVDMNAIPQDLNGFDFCWSSCAFEHLGSIKAGLTFVRESVRTLKPGGLAVHTTELNLSSNRDTVDRESTVIFRRRDMEQLALDLVSRGHEVAQINYDQGSTPLDDYVDMPPYASNNHLKVALGKYVTTSFGLIVRRGTGA